MITEWNTEDAIAFARAEEREEALQEGREERNTEIARNALAEGSTPEFVQKITGLDAETISKLVLEGK